MTEPTPDAPPVDPNDPVPTDPTTPVEEEPPAEEDPGGEQPAIPSDTPCTSTHPNVVGVVCEIQFDNHAVFRLTHVSHANGTIYEWE